MAASPRSLFGNVHDGTDTLIGKEPTDGNHSDVARRACLTSNCDRAVHVGVDRDAGTVARPSASWWNPFDTGTVVRAAKYVFALNLIGTEGPRLTIRNDPRTRGSGGRLTAVATHSKERDHHRSDDR
jgi:hypothetical protein